MDDQNPFASPQPPDGPQQYRPPQPYGAAPPWQPPAQSQDVGLAVGALVTGILSLVGELFCLPFGILGIVAVILGVIGMSKAKAGTAGGYGMALAGTICGGIALLIGVGLLLFFGLFLFAGAAAAGS